MLAKVLGSIFRQISSLSPSYKMTNCDGFILSWCGFVNRQENPGTPMSAASAWYTVRRCVSWPGSAARLRRSWRQFRSQRSSTFCTNSWRCTWKSRPCLVRHAWSGETSRDVNLEKRQERCNFEVYLGGQSWYITSSLPARAHTHTLSLFPFVCGKEREGKNTK